MNTSSHTAKALEKFRSQTITPQQFMQDLMEFLSLIYGTSLCHLKRDDSELLSLQNPPITKSPLSPIDGNTSGLQIISTKLS